MSVRLEWTEAQYAGPSRLHRGDTLEDGNRVTHEWALAIGPLVIEGSYDDLVALTREAHELFVAPDGLDPLASSGQTV